MQVAGIDIGTSNIKIIIVEKNGKIIQRYSHPVTTINNKSGFQEQNWQVIFSDLITLMEQIKHKYSDVELFSLSCAMHSMILLDHNNRPLTNAIIWSDTRAHQELQNLTLKYDKKQIHKISGLPLHTMSWVGKIIWFQTHKKALWNKVTKIISLKEYIIFKLFGVFQVDYSIASSSGIFNAKHLRWDHELLKILKISPHMLSTVTSPLKQLSNVDKIWVKNLGKNFKMIVGAADGCLANLGAGVTDQSKLVVSFGTSSAVRTTINTYVDHSNEKLFCYPLFKDFFVVGGASNNAGNVIDWYRNKIRNKLTFNQIWHEFDLSKPGANGIIFLPYLHGERAPYWIPEAKGAFLNLVSFHNSQDLTRAVIEANIFTIDLIIKNMENKYHNFSEIIISGKIAKNHTWLQLLANVTGKKIITLQCTEIVAMASAYLGFMALNIFKNIDQIKSWIKINHIFTPNQNLYNLYQELVSKHDKWFKIINAKQKE